MAAGSLLLCLAVLATGLLFIPQGYGTRCYEYTCSNSSMGPAQNCTAPVAKTCNAGEICVKTFITMTMKLNPTTNVVISQDMRACAPGMQCLPYVNRMSCDQAKAQNNTDVTYCGRECCKADLCNNDSFMPKLLPKPTGTPAPQQCYVCVNEPNKTNSCNKPMLQTCKPMGPGAPPPDGCLTFKSTARDPLSGQEIEMEMRNCTLKAMCDLMDMCKQSNATGILTKCSNTCCKGDKCNNEGVSTPTINSDAVQPVKQVFGILFGLCLTLLWSV